MLQQYWPIRVYYEDTDSGGVVYHANYLRFFERGRTEWLRAFGFEQDRIMAEMQVLFAVRSMEIDFIRPARFNQQLQVETSLHQLGKASLQFNQRLLLEPSPPNFEANGKAGMEFSPICEARVRIACLDAHGFKPRPIPPAMIEEIVRARG